MKKATRFKVVSLNFSWHQPVEAESFEEAEDLAGPIADNADEDLMHLGDGKLLPHGVIVTVLTKYSTRNLETVEELRH